MNVLVFAFNDTIAARVLAAIDVPIQKMFIASNTEAINSFIEQLGDQSYVIGLGEYSGRDHSKLRIEVRCTSRFRNSGSDANVFIISDQLRPGASSKIAEGIGNSWCNYASFAAAQKIGPSKYGFVHIPKSFTLKEATNEINGQIALILNKNDARW